MAKRPVKIFSQNIFSLVSIIVYFYFVLYFAFLSSIVNF